MTAPDDALAAIEAHGVQSADDALAMADAILDPENDGVEWLMQHGCDVMDHLRAEVRSLRAHIASEPERVAAAVDAALAAERGRCVAVCRARAEKRRGEADAETAAAEYGEAMESRELAREADALADAIAATRGAR